MKLVTGTAVVAMDFLPEDTPCVFDEELNVLMVPKGEKHEAVERLLALYATGAPSSSRSGGAISRRD